MTVNTIRELLENAAHGNPEKLAITLDGDRYTYAGLFERVNQVAHYLTTLNLPKGSRIGIYSNKSCDQVIAILAIMSTEHIFVPITRLLKPEQVKHIIEDCGITCIITDTKKIETVKATGFSGKIISYTPTEESDVSFEEIYKCYTGKHACDIKGHDNAAITYTFSSTGNPKGIVINHRALFDGAAIVAKYLDIRSDDVISGILSFNLDYGLNQIYTALFKQATLAIHKFVLPSDFFTHLINDGVTVLPLMPIHITQMFDEDPHRIPKPEHFNKLRTITSSGGNITPLMIKNITTHFPDAKFYSMHGLSEAFRSAYLDPAQIHIRPNSIGKAVPDVELYIINEEGEACKPREVGELIHRGACIYKGYWNAPEETRKRFKSIQILDKVLKPEGNLTDEIVVASGDYVYADEEGYIYFVCRKDDMIKTQGYRVSPYEIESVVYENIPEITECIVFSIPNEEIEEEIVMVYGGKRELPKNEILFELKKHLPNYMLPAQIVYNPNMPRKSLHSKQIDKEALRKEFV
ncbi:AMP-binding protein [Hydrogenimonas sp.]|uniref:AMP-binding protein n=1 Tax=Hydrogenimonas sp. TaxID=2231112 RepID=UPI0026057D9E|nr:AMP-binding protein [Hydrogenimonas sp.]